MKLHRLLFREIAHRKFNFLMGSLSVAVAVGCGVATVLLLDAFDRDTKQTLASMADQSRKEWARYTDDVRKDMLTLGFNLMILHKDQNLSNPDTHARTLPEDYALTLAKSKLIDINHVLPFLQQKFWWAERNRWITLVGTTGEVYIKNPKKQTPMLQAVPRGRATLGYAIHQSLKLKAGDRIALGGREFVVEKCLGPKGFTEDENVFVPLRDAQDLLKKAGRITGMLAINCQCNPEGLLGIQKNISRLLPDTRVIEHSTKLIARAEVRSKAARQADADLKRTQAARVTLRVRRRAFGAALIPLVVIVSAVWLGLLMWDNVRRRRGEIGILRALGLTGGKVLALFLGKALLIGIAGAVVGFVGGLVVSAAMVGGAALGALGPVLLLVSVATAAVLSLVASWVPAQVAAGTDPAVVLQKESL